MKRITDQMIERAWSELTGVAAAGQAEPAEALMEAFATTQPALSELLARTFDGLGPEATDLAWFAGLVVFRALGPDLAEVPPERVIAEYRATEAWIAGLSASGTDPILLEKKLRDFAQYGEPELMRYVVEAILDAHEDGLEVAPAELERVFLVLRALVRCFED
jgi:hypothetical protein